MQSSRALNSWKKYLKNDSVMRVGSQIFESGEWLKSDVFSLHLYWKACVACMLFIKHSGEL